jgi:hypothetical protein
MNVEIIDITDVSGSMHDIRNDIIGGFNTLVADQKKVPGEARLTYVQFDNEYGLRYAGKNIQEVPELAEQDYIPRGGTALLDAIGRTLNEQGQRIAAEKWADKVIVCIRTDGQENASREYTLTRVKEMIAHAQAHDWVFIFSGADIDAFGVSSSLGINTKYTRGYDKSDPLGTQDSYYAVGASIAEVRGFTGAGSLGTQPQDAMKTAAKNQLSVDTATQVKI